jgi:hypothetical protein
MSDISIDLGTSTIVIYSPEKGAAVKLWLNLLTYAAMFYLPVYFVKNEVSTYINPDSAEVWLMEEPTKRGAGQVKRAIEQHRTKYGSQMDTVAAAYCHQVYRIDEFFRFRKTLREKDKIIIRSRSEESACYQIYDQDHLQDGISEELYLNLPGHQIAFGNPPTHIFIVCAPEDWTKEQYLEMKAQRSGDRMIDDYEANFNYQLLVNRRYASNWLENLYQKACQIYNSTPPQIVRFSIYDSKEEIKAKMSQKIKEILNYE